MSNWFADKLGPYPTSPPSPEAQRKLAQLAAQKQADAALPAQRRQQAAAPQQRQQTAPPKAAPAPAPEPKKEKKKGWF